MKFRESSFLSYDDIMLVPQKGILKNRKNANISSNLVGWMRLDVPIVASPMNSVVNAEVAKAMFKAGGFSFLHRFNTPDEQTEEFQIATIDNLGERNAICGAAFGLKDGKERIEKLYESGCRVFLLDVAHAHTLSVMDSLAEIIFPEDAYLIVGSIATAEAASDFIEMGIHGLRVGIGPGAACTTREVTGFGVGQLSAILEIAEVIADNDPVRRPTLMADGSIKTSGDIVKALAAGADTVMVGRLLASTKEAPHPGEYFGMASHRINGHNAPEGAEGKVEITGTVEEVMKNLAWGIRSGFSYGGARTIQELREKAECAIISDGVFIESKVRI